MVFSGERPSLPPPTDPMIDATGCPHQPYHNVMEVHPNVSHAFALSTISPSLHLCANSGHRDPVDFDNCPRRCGVRDHPLVRERIERLARLVGQENDVHVRVQRAPQLAGGSDYRG